MKHENKILDLNSFKETKAKDNSAGVNFAYHTVPFLKSEALLKLLNFKFKKKNFEIGELFIDKHIEKDDNPV